MQDSKSSLLKWLDQFILTARVAANRVCLSQCGMDIDHTRLLRIIVDNPNQPVSLVVKESYLDRTLVSRAISRFVKQKLVKRMISPADARQVLLKITPAGEKLVKQANALRDAMELQVLSVLSDEERGRFEQCMVKLSKWTPKDFAHFERTRKRSKTAGRPVPVSDELAD